MVIMGRIVAPYGIFGWVKILPDTEAIDGLFDYDTWWVGKDNAWQEYEIETAKVHNNVLVAKLVGVDDRDEALRCKGKQVAVPRDQLPKAGEDEYYWSDLIGLSVKNKQGIEFGKITDVFETGSNDVFVVNQDSIKIESAPLALNKPSERLIPFIANVVLEVDIVARTMLVDWDAEF